MVHRCVSGKAHLSRVSLALGSMVRQQACPSGAEFTVSPAATVATAVSGPVARPPALHIMSLDLTSVTGLLKFVFFLRAKLDIARLGVTLPLETHLT